MSVYSGKTIIRELRLMQGLTQKQLAEGICSRETINLNNQLKITKLMKV